MCDSVCLMMPKHKKLQSQEITYLLGMCLHSWCNPYHTNTHSGILSPLYFYDAHGSAIDELPTSHLKSRRSVETVYGCTIPAHQRGECVFYSVGSFSIQLALNRGRSWSCGDRWPPNVVYLCGVFAASSGFTAEVLPLSCQTSARHTPCLMNSSSNCVAVICRERRVKRSMHSI